MSTKQLQAEKYSKKMRPSTPIGKHAARLRAQQAAIAATEAMRSVEEALEHERAPVGYRSARMAQATAKLFKGMGRNKILREIKFYQKTTEHLIPRAPFSRLVREVLSEVENENKNGVEADTIKRIKKDALNALQEACEDAMLKMLADINLVTLSCKRVTIKPRDLHLIQELSARWGHVAPWDKLDRL
ncbi:histone-fold-containing protein [Geopyxis carbonaria]|nr:histone-fold-containing protein [Geopyxis carbonaria]